MPPLRTFMSRVMARYPAESAGDQGVRLDQIAINGRKLFWVDEMLEGGLEIPLDLWDSWEGSPSFTLLLAGAPGTGKTMFALELCYNLARWRQPFNNLCWSSLYVSAETPGQRIKDNAISLGWKPECFHVLEAPSRTAQGPSAFTFEYPHCNVFGSEHFEETHDPSVSFQVFLEAYRFSNPRCATEGLMERICGARMQRNMPPDVVVIDSLNLLWPLYPGPSTADAANSSPGGAMLQSLTPRPLNLLATFFKLRSEIGGGRSAKRPKLLIMILDAFSGETAHNPWEYVADAVIRFDGAVGQENYYSRSFQINKVKTQTHALGSDHVYKILRGAHKAAPAAGSTATQQSARSADDSPIGDTTGKRDPAASPEAEVDKMPIPYPPPGGTFVFPSIHWHLSRSIREDPVPEFHRTNNYPTGLSRLDSILGSAELADKAGFPSMHTTALVGRRGAMKSHLAYHFMLSHALGGVSGDEQPKNVLLVSLRDDLGAARNTLARLIKQQQLISRATDADDIMESLLQSDRLEILYNWPGCVTPNEFFHRIFVALARQREMKPLRSSSKRQIPSSDVDSSAVFTKLPERGTAELVVLNGLDHLDVKFPLCATEQVFVPALISLFRCFKVCSIVVSGEDRPGSSHDIRPLSDMILEFSNENAEDRIKAQVPAEAVQTSKVLAVRVPAGQIGGRWGVLGRSKTECMSFYPATEP